MIKEILHEKAKKVKNQYPVFCAYCNCLNYVNAGYDVETRKNFVEVDFKCVECGEWSEVEVEYSLVLRSERRSGLF